MTAMSGISFTDSQNEAIGTVDQHVLVSAAAGSGKTAVLAARCVYLVSDAPSPFRCDIDDIVVLTFTDAAAAEMRSRIRDGLARKASSSPADGRLQRQIVRASAARISTIHSFCFWLIKRSFRETGLDPAVRLLDESEATLLRAEVLQNLWDGLYRDAFSGEARPPSGTADGFIAFVDTYGLGQDDGLAETVIEIHEFLRSLSRPEDWIEDVRKSAAGGRDEMIIAMLDDLVRETDRQLAECGIRSDLLRRRHATCDGHAALIDEYAAALEGWHAEADRLRSATCSASSDDTSAAVGTLLESMKAYSFPSARRLSRVDKTDEDAVSAREYGKGVFENTRNKLWKSRLLDRRTRFTVNERCEGHASVRPYVETVLTLVKAFDRAYLDAKRRANVLDFSDLERHAFAILSEGGDPDCPSEIARSMQRRFSHVLVDEYQDINPLQEAIIRLVSRDPEPAMSDNLFVVGDVKQSIYRFRLAEPTLFADRQRRYVTDSSAGRCVLLRENFRSRKEVLDAVNLVFEPLMRYGDVRYDEDARLVHGRDEKPGAEARHVPVEIHLLERQLDSYGHPNDTGDALTDSGSGESESGVDATSGAIGEDGSRVNPAAAEEVTFATLEEPPSEWDPIEREAYQIGAMIQSWMADEKHTLLGRPVQLGDVAVLLRSKKVNAERVVSMLTAMGLPAKTDAGGSLLTAVEVRDVLAVLQVLDNPRQDIPLAAVLRNGVIAPALTEDELVALLQSATEGDREKRKSRFHEAVISYIESGSNGSLGEKVRQVFGEIERLRALARRRPLAEVLHAIYDTHGFMGYVGGRPGGRRRQANLQQLVSLARQCHRSRRRGVHGFLRFVEELQKAGNDIKITSTDDPQRDAIQVMTIHASKGLQFPIVFLPGLGNKLNLRDRMGSVIYERRAGIGIRVFDREKRVEYPSWTYNRVAETIDAVSREEELRILYVGMTRAEEKLVMLGSVPKPLTFTGPDMFSEGLDVTEMAVHAASKSLDWVLPALHGARAGSVHVGASKDRRCVIEMHVHEAEDIAQWRKAAGEPDGTQGLLEQVAGLQPLPAGEPVSSASQAVDDVLRRVDYMYPFESLTRLPSVLAATETGGYTAVPSDEESSSVDVDVSATAAVGAAGRRPLMDTHSPFAPVPQRSLHGDEAEADVNRGGLEDVGRSAGLVMHRVLEHLDFGSAHSASALEDLLQSLVSRSVIAAEDVEVVDVDSLLWFLGTELASRIRDAGDRFLREFRYTLMESYERYGEATGADVSAENAEAGRTSADDVLVRGTLDGVLVTASGVEVVDYKTDGIEAAEAVTRAERYHSQIGAYLRASSRLFRRPATVGHLVFLRARTIVRVDNVQIAGV